MLVLVPRPPGLSLPYQSASGAVFARVDPFSLITAPQKLVINMANIIDVPKPRINCSMLSQHINRPVCFVGRVEKVHPTGKTFTVSDGDGKTATVELNEPLEEELCGAVEIIGMVSNKGVIMASTYNMLREDKGIPFDIQLYNEALRIIHDFPQHYPFEGAASG